MRTWFVTETRVRNTRPEHCGQLDNPSHGLPVGADQLTWVESSSTPHYSIEKPQRTLARPGVLYLRKAVRRVVGPNLRKLKYGQYLIERSGPSQRGTPSASRAYSFFLDEFIF